MRKRMGCYGGWLTTRGKRKSGRRKATKQRSDTTVVQEPDHRTKYQAYHLTRTRVSGSLTPSYHRPLRRAPDAVMPLYRRPIKSPRKWFPKGSWCHGDKAFLYNRKGTMKMTTKNEIHLFATNRK